MLTPDNNTAPIPESSYNFLNDILFKHIFGSENKKQITIGFLNSILKLEDSNAIKAITFKNSELLPQFVDQKLGRLDVFAITNDGKQIDIEVQVANYHNMPQRSMFYWSNMYLSASMQGDDYAELPPTITINIMGYNFLPQSAPHSRYVLYNPDTNHQLSDVLELHFIEIKKFDTTKAVKDMTKAERWMAFLANKLNQQTKEDLMNADPLISEAYNLANIFMLDEDARRKYINRQMAIRDFNNAHHVAYNNGQKNVFKLISWLSKHNRVADAARAADDPDYQQKLMAEYKAAMDNQAE